MREIPHQALILLFMIIPGLVYASDAYIKTGKSIGQGFLLERQNTCYLITPKHVVEGGDDISFMTADRKNYKAETIKVFDVDLAVLKVNAFKACINKQAERKTRLISLLKIYSDYICKSSPLPVSICSKLGRYCFRIFTIPAFVTCLDSNSSWS